MSAPPKKEAAPAKDAASSGEHEEKTTPAVTLQDAAGEIAREAKGGWA